MRRRWITAGLLIALIVGVLFALRTRDAKQAVAVAEPSSAEVHSVAFLSPEIEKVVRPGFVGPDACSECHRNIHKAFLETKHPRTLREVRAEDLPKEITEPGSQFVSRDERIRFITSLEGGRYYQTAIEKTIQGDRTTKSSIDLVLGAGGIADDVLLTWHSDGIMRELPLAWLYPTNECAASHFDPNSGGDFGRLLTLRCIECHSTWVHHVPGTLNQYRREGRILGVTCEACHGPGESHVRFHHENPKETIAKNIVLPSKLERERQIEVCTQCHSNAMKHLGPAFSYRTGEPLDEHYKSVTTKATEDDRVANQITYLRRSKCFVSDERMTCTTCHSPHKANNATNSGSATCNKCHVSDACTDRPNLPTEIQNDCVGCHMPSYLKININFQTKGDDYVPPLRRTEHRIASYPHAKNEVLLKHFAKQTDEASQQKVIELRQALVVHFEKEAQSCRQSYRYLGATAALREVVRIHDTKETREQLKQAVQFQADLDKLSTDAQRQLRDNNPAQALATFQRILAIKPNDANAQGRIGTEYARIGDRAKAIEHWTAVAEHDPNDAYGLGMLAWQAFLDRRDDEAIAYYRQAEAIEPRQAKMKYQMGLVLSRLGRLPDAIKKFKEALAIEPQNTEAIQAVVLASLEAGTAQEAIPYIEFVARATQMSDPGSLMMLADVYSAAGHKEHARNALRLALPIARVQAPDLLQELQSKIQTLGK